ncbi:MAG: anaerobic ribonucleoside-triphosphate reductase activating protein [Actinobacteria bacterium]|nr:MAG: anaerobic ribonucleoside-triphosphate reductase activating protein [Actinomycetota bacterium]
MSASPTRNPTAKAPTQRLAGWLPVGMLDWPGRVTTTIFLGGCDFRCPFCHNAALIETPADPASWNGLSEHLESKRGWLDGVVITGGEPTTDPDLDRVLQLFSRMQLPVKLDTNGNNPEVLESVLADGLVSYIALDLKTAFDRYDALTGVRNSGARVSRSVELIIASGVPHEFRTTAYPGAIVLDDLVDIARSVEGGDRYAVQQFVAESTLDPRASAVLPYRPDALAATVGRCNEYIPTMLRGA